MPNPTDPTKNPQRPDQQKPDQGGQGKPPREDEIDRDRTRQPGETEDEERTGKRGDREKGDTGTEREPIP